MDNKRIIEVVGAIIRGGDRYLVGQRAANKAQKDNSPNAYFVFSQVRFNSKGLGASADSLGDTCRNGRP